MDLDDYWLEQALEIDPIFQTLEIDATYDFISWDPFDINASVLDIQSTRKPLEPHPSKKKIIEKWRKKKLQKIGKAYKPYRRADHKVKK